MEAERGTAPHAGRGWKAEGDATFDIGVRVKKLFVCLFRAADEEVSPAKIPNKGSLEDISFLCEVMGVVRNPSVGGDFARHGKLGKGTLVVEGVVPFLSPF